MSECECDNGTIDCEDADGYASATFCPDCEEGESAREANDAYWEWFLFGKRPRTP